MYPEPDSKCKPEDVGTRLRHYQELWRVGLEIYRGMNPEYINVDRMKQLEAGVTILEKQIDILSGYDKKHGTCGMRLTGFRVTLPKFRLTKPLQFDSITAWLLLILMS